MKQFFKVFLIFFVVFSVTIGSGLWWYLNKEDQEKEIEVRETQTEELEEKELKERVNILVVGIDALDSKYAEKGARTDTMMVFSLDPKSNTAFLLSIPRDSRVPIRNRGLDKINHAHAYGGIDLTLKAVKDLLQIPIHHYIRIDYKALFKTVDDIKGIEVELPKDIYHSDPYATPPLLINIKKGKHVLNGQQAMEYLRYRGYDGDPDLVRISNQQDFVQKMMKKILSPASVALVPKYIETWYSYVDTDMSKKDMLELAKDGIKLDPSKLRKDTLPGEGKYIGRISYFILDEEKMREQIAFLLAGNYEEAAAEGGEQTAEGGENTPSQNAGEDLTQQQPVEEKPQMIIVQNGSGKKGMAKRVSDLLKISDIEVQKTGNADNFNYKNTLIYYSGNKKFAESVQAALGKGQLVEDSEKLKNYKTDLLIVVGKDFN